MKNQLDYPVKMDTIDHVACGTIFVFIFVVFPLMVLVGLGYWAESIRCQNTWEKAGLTGEYSFSTGCMVNKKDGTWIPENSIRSELM